MQFPNKRLKKISTAATSTRSPQAAVTCCDKGGGVMSCPLPESQHPLKDDCFSDTITAVCKLSEACPCKGQTTELGLTHRQVLTRSYNFHYQRELQGAAGIYCTSDSSWQRLQRFLLEASAGSLLHENEACELPISSETFALTWLLY